MVLTSGTRLGVYEVTAIGEGSRGGARTGHRPSRSQIVVAWFAQLKRLVPAK
jgi:hypothetical protein